MTEVGAVMRLEVTLATVALLLGCTSGRDVDSTAAATVSANAADQPGAEREKSFLAESDAAMEKMMRDMAIEPTGDVDRDFVAMMAPHHQGAIDIAVAELRYGHSEQLRRLAQEIIVTQQEEIAAMHQALGEPLPPSVPSPTTPPTGR